MEINYKLKHFDSSRIKWFTLLKQKFVAGDLDSNVKKIGLFFFRNMTYLSGEGWAEKIS